MKTIIVFRKILMMSLLLAFGAIFFSVTASAASYTPPTSNRVDTVINNDWRFNKGDVAGAEAVNYNDSAWSLLNVPHTWNAFDGQDGGNDYYRGIGWYRKHVTISPSLSNRKIYLQFDGAFLVTDVYINGIYLGQHKGGFAKFRFDATPYINFGTDNVIAVKVNNANNADIAPVSGDLTNFGGLYRGVHILATDKLQIRAMDLASDGVYLKQYNVSNTSANLDVLVKTWNNNSTVKSVTVNAVVVDALGNIVKTLTDTRSIAASTGYDFTLSTVISNPHLWNGVIDPYLYNVYVEIKDGTTVTDLVKESLGFRYYRVDPDTGFYLNGEHYDLHGVNRHQDRQNKGWAISDADQLQDMDLIKEMGANMIRLAHYQQDDYFLSLADSYGMIVWEEIPINWGLSTSSAFIDNAKQQLTEMIRQDFNNPSVIFWGLENETDNLSTVIPQLNTLAHTEDPYRITTIAQNLIKTDSDPDNWLADNVGFNKYYGWYGGTTSDFGSWADQIHASYPNKNIGVSEYGAGAGVTIHSATPVNQDHSEEYQSIFHEETWNQMKVRDFLWCKLVWNMFDFAVDNRDEGEAAGRNDKGMVTYDRLTKKDAFYWYKANWSNDPFVYITSRRYTNRTMTSNDIKIYSNTDSVELKVNGTSLGSKTSSNHIFTWSGVQLQPGSNSIQAIGTRTGSAFMDSVTWNMQPNVRIDAGSRTSFTDSNGKYYANDTYYSGGLTSMKTNTIGNTTDPNLFQTYRYGTFSYNLPVDNGTYNIYLKFMEPFFSSAGSRVFKVTAEGNTILNNLDIYQEAGKFNAIEKTASVTVTDGILNLNFIPSADNAIVSGIAVVKQ